MPIKMINLQTFFKNHFITANIVDQELYKFGDDHNGRLQANNPANIYDPLIVAITTAVADFLTARSGKDTGLSIQQGKTIVMNQKLRDFINAVQDIEPFIRYTYRAAPGTYEEFFPQGLTEFTNANLGNVEVLMSRMVDRLTAHVAEMLAANVTLFTNFRSAFTTARDEQVFQFGTVEGANTLKQTTHDALSVQLMRNMLIIASNNVGHTERMNDYFDQSIIRLGTGGGEDGTITGEVAALSFINIESQGISDTTQFRLKNTGTVDLTFCLAADDATSCGNGVLLHSLEEVTVTAGMLGTAGNHFLNVTNHDVATVGLWEVEIL